MTKGEAPLLDYCVKIMILESLQCYQQQDLVGLKWLEKALFDLSKRWAELDDQE